MNLSERQDQFSELLAECSRTFLTTPEGEEERLGYLRARVSAQHNYAAVAQLETQGIDITDAVLFKLLPHTDTELHRTQGAWLHSAAFISGDLRRWYEASGMTRPNAWPTIARALWQLIQSCLADPAHLEEACHAFAAEPATKGFQTGIVTPILNALQPDHFLLLSRKSRTTLNYFTGADFGHTMLDYPAANAALQHFIDEQANLQQLAAALEMRPAISLTSSAIGWSASTTLPFTRPPIGGSPWTTTRLYGSNGKRGAMWGSVGMKWAMWLRSGKTSSISAATACSTNIRSWRKGDLNQLWRFAHQLHEGDKVLVTGAQNRLLGYGTVAGPYYFVSEVGLGHRRPMEWDDLTPRQADLPDGRGLIKVQAAPFAAPPKRRPLLIRTADDEHEAHRREKPAIAAPTPQPSPRTRATPPMA